MNNRTIIKYFKVWKHLSVLAINSYMCYRIDSWCYLAGKIVRFAFFLLLIFSLFNFTKSIAEYSKYEVVLFYLTFNLMDVLGQAFFRGIYGFQGLVRSGGFDYILSKPVSPLFYCLTRTTDVLDLLFLIPIIALIAFTITKVPIAVSAAHILLYVLFIILGMIIVLGLHIITACISIRTLESENVIWLYRETMTLGRFPPEIFSPFIQAIFTFVFPIIIIVAFPTKILLGLLQWHWILFTIIYTVIFFTISLWLWDNSLKHYSSASS